MPKNSFYCLQAGLCLGILGPMCLVAALHAQESVRLAPFALNFAFLLGAICGFFCMGAVWVGIRLVAGMVGGSQQQQGSRLPLPHLPGATQMNYDWKLTDLAGQELEMNHFRGKVLFLNLWATWCPPCKAELSNLERLYAALHDVDGMEFAFISTEKPEVLLKFVVDRPLTLPLYLATQLPADLPPGGFPTTWIVSRQGRILVRHCGAAAWDDTVCQEFLRSLVSGEEIGATPTVEIQAEPVTPLVCAPDGSSCQVR